MDELPRHSDGTLDMSAFPDEDVDVVTRRQIRRALSSLDTSPAPPRPARRSRPSTWLAAAAAIAALGVAPVALLALQRSDPDEVLLRDAAAPLERDEPGEQRGVPTPIASDEQRSDGRGAAMSPAEPSRAGTSPIDGPAWLVDGPQESPTTRVVVLDPSELGPSEPAEDTLADVSRATCRVDVVGAGSELRSAPDASADLVRKVPAGRYLVLDRSSDWLQIDVEAQLGWIAVHEATELRCR